MASSAEDRQADGSLATAFKWIVVLLAAVVALAAGLVWSLVRNGRDGADAVRLALPSRENLIQKKFPEVDFSRLYPGMSPAEIDGVQRESLALRYVYEPFVDFAPVPTTGKFLNIAPDGFRLGRERQPWPPPKDELVVFVFGGSTTLGFGVRDEDTLVSALEESLRRHFSGHTVRCYNFGRGYYFSTQERLLFEALAGRGVVPDLAVFVDGLNDFVYHDGVPQFAGNFFQATAPDLPVPTRSPIATEAERARAVEALLTRYANNVRLIEAVARAQGSIPIFIGQPVPFLDTPLDAVRYPFKSTFAEHVLANWGYGRFKEAARSGRFGANFVWCGNAFAQLDAPAFVDSIHYSAAGAKTLAETIVTRSLEAGLIPR